MRCAYFVVHLLLGTAASLLPETFCKCLIMSTTHCVVETGFSDHQGANRLRGQPYRVCIADAAAHLGFRLQSHQGQLLFSSGEGLGL